MWIKDRGDYFILKVRGKKVHKEAEQSVSSSIHSVIQLAFQQLTLCAMHLREERPKEGRCENCIYSTGAWPSGSAPVSTHQKSPIIYSRYCREGAQTWLEARRRHTTPPQRAWNPPR